MPALGFAFALLIATPAIAQTFAVAALNVTDVPNDNLRAMGVPPGFSTGLVSVPGTYEGSGLTCDSSGSWWSVSDKGWVARTTANGATLQHSSLHYIREIADISRTNPAVVTTTGMHRWTTGESIALYSTGFNSVNGTRTMTVINSTKFSLNGVDATQEPTPYNVTAKPGRVVMDSCYLRPTVGPVNFEGIEVDPAFGAYGWLLEERSSDSCIHEFNLAANGTANNRRLGHFSRSIDISGIIGDGLGNNGPEGICYVPNAPDRGTEPGIFLIARQQGACIYRIRVSIGTHNSLTVTNLPNSPFTPIPGRNDIGDIDYKDGVLWVSYDANDTVAAFRCDGSSNVSLIHEWQTRTQADGFPYVTAEGITPVGGDLFIAQDGPSGGTNDNALVRYPSWRHGTVQPSIMNVAAGIPAVFLATPDAGWQVDTWYVDGVPQTGKSELEFSIVPTMNHTVSVSFRRAG